jgi:hypothetical protein
MSSGGVLGGSTIPRQTIVSFLPDRVPPGGQIEVLLVNVAASAYTWIV